MFFYLITRKTVTKKHDESLSFDYLIYVYDIYLIYVYDIYIYIYMIFSVNFYQILLKISNYHFSFNFIKSKICDGRFNCSFRFKCSKAFSSYC